MKQSYLGGNAILVGNGINRVCGSQLSWAQLLKDIARNYDIKVDIDNPLKPFPLSFEEMLSGKQGITSSDDKLKNLKTRIKDVLEKDAEKLIQRDLFQKIFDTAEKEILTTNYDYNLETSKLPDFIKIKKGFSLNNRESKHSLFRGYDINGKKIRHIHGELSTNRAITNKDSYLAESIMIGFEHYSTYLHTIQNNVQGTSGGNPDDKNILFRIKEEILGKSWCDLFFTHNVHILGLTLDFSENHLWWLLLYRIQQMRKSNKFNVKVNNKIYFYYKNSLIQPSSTQLQGEKAFEEYYNKKINLDRTRAIGDMLSSLGVTIVPLDVAEYQDFYNMSLDLINDNSNL